MNYQISLYPVSLFEANKTLRQPDRPQLVEAIWNYVSPTSDNAVTQTVPGADHSALDAGSLLHYLKWMDGAPTVQLQMTTPHSQPNTMRQQMLEKRGYLPK